jgi:hypothetical protein
MQVERSPHLIQGDALVLAIHNRMLQQAPVSDPHLKLLPTDKKVVDPMDLPRTLLPATSE